MAAEDLLRSGAELVRASQVFAVEDTVTTWRLVLTTLFIASVLEGTILWSGSLWLQIPASVVMGLVGVRLFIFFHDWAHKAIYRDSRWGDALMTLIGVYTLSAPSVWKETHDYHHRNNARMVGSTIGSYPTVTLSMYRNLTTKQRRLLKAVRHPLSIALGFFTTFLMGMCFAAWRRNPKAHRMIPVVVLSWFTVYGLLISGFGLLTASLAWLFPCMIHSGLGSYLFYAQHNYPMAELRGRRTWNFTHAALKCSSFFEMPSVMHWFTGNIGYHHVHHLNHRIPFYQLPKAMAALPELQSPGRTSWRLSDIRAALRCSVWHEQEQRLISFAEADAARLELELDMAAK